MVKKNYKKPNLFVYYGIFRVGSWFYSKFKLNLKVVRNETKKHKGPFVVISNHESVIDFMTLGSTMKRSHFVISSSFYNTSPIKGLMKTVRIIPKQQFQTSPADLKKMKNVIDNNMPLVIFPAGMMPEHGASTPIPESTVKFLKWLKTDIYVANIKGTYLSKPKWSNIRRKGKTYLDIYKLYSKEELANLSNEELTVKVNEVLNFDAYENQENLMIKYKNVDNLEGLENVLYKCPKCNSEFKMKTTNNIMECLECGNKVKGDEYGFIHPVTEEDHYYRHPSKWANKIREELLNEIKENPSFTMETSCKVHIIKGKKYEYVGDAVVKLDLENITIKGVLEGKDFQLTVPSYQYITIPFKPGSCFEVQDKDISYRLYIENGKEVTKWVWAIQSLAVLHNLNK